MNILDVSKKIVDMYKLDINPSKEEWNDIFSKFEFSLSNCDELNTLLECIFYDDEWYIPFEYRMQLMRKAKKLGAHSEEFLIDYYDFQAAFLDPGEEHDYAVQMLNSLIGE